MARTYVGIGFGAIQSGLFLYEAFRSGAFDRYVIAEVMPDVINAVQNNQGRYMVNIARADGIVQEEIGPIELLNPAEAEDRRLLHEACIEASEIGVALPSVEFYTRGSPSPADVLAAAFSEKEQQQAPRCLVYAGENHNHAAEHLQAAAETRTGRTCDRVQYLNTVIGKMSGVVTDKAQIQTDGLAEISPELPRAFLVEAFNRILISRCEWSDFERGIRVFEEKEDLLPFEEAKLYGHNAVHALLGYLAHEQGIETMSAACKDESLMTMARSAFLEESGAALIRKHQGIDELFTIEGFSAYAEDLLQRMGNPFLRDAVQRVIRDPERKLGWDDRLIGTIRLALKNQVQPFYFCKAALAALRLMAAPEDEKAEITLRKRWPADADPAEIESVLALLI